MSSNVKVEGFIGEDDVTLSSDEEDVKQNVKSEGAEENDYVIDDETLDLDTSQEDRKVWLVRMPKFLMDKWRDVDKISGKDLGKVKISNEPSGKNPFKVKLVLNDTPENSTIPHEYDMALVRQGMIDNTYVFTEQDAGRGGPMRVKREQGGDGSNNVGSSSAAPYRRPNIPKKTALVGTACHECVVTPSLRDPNYNHVVAQRKTIEQEMDRPKVTLLKELPGVTAGAFTSMSAANNSMFMRSTREKRTDSKATRIPKNELLDLLFKLFEEYDYWSMKGLRERTKQPEVYLKEVLDSMAVLTKKGPYAMKYCLKPEFQKIKGIGQSLSSYMGIEGEEADRAEGDAGGTGVGVKPEGADESEDVDMKNF